MTAKTFELTEFERGKFEAFKEAMAACRKVMASWDSVTMAVNGAADCELAIIDLMPREWLVGRPAKPVNQQV